MFSLLPSGPFVPHGVLSYTPRMIWSPWLVSSGVCVMCKRYIYVPMCINYTFCVIVYIVVVVVIVPSVGFRYIYLLVNMFHCNLIIVKTHDFRGFNF